MLFFLIMSKGYLQAQNNASLGMRYTGGKIIKHNTRLTYNPPNYADNIELNYFKKRNGNATWMKNYHYPTTGFTVSWLNYKDQKLGTVISIMPTIAFTLVQYKKFDMNARLGGGVAYATKYWHRTPFTDSINNYLGSAVNLYATINIDGHYSINRIWAINAGVALNHVSNAGIRKPNFGINLLGASVGVSYAIANHNSVEITKQDTASNTTTLRKYVAITKHRFGLDARLGCSMAEYGIGDGPLVPIYTDALFGTYTYRAKHKFLLGIDYELNSKTLTFIRTTKQATDNEILDASYICAVVGNEFLFGNFSIPTQIGTYLNNAYLQPSKTYSKFGLFYYPYLHKHQYGRGMYVGTLLKSNNFVADFLEINVGYSF